MNKKLLKRLGLAEDATPEQIEAAVGAALDRIATLEGKIEGLEKNPAGVETAEGKLEKRIAAKIAQSGGALNRTQAQMAIEHQDAATAKKNAPAKK